MGRKKRVGDDELLAVAREMFVAKGIGASTRDIARQAGVSEAVLFQRFRTKPELFFAAMIPPAPDIHALLVAPSPRRPPALQFEEIGLRMLAYFRQVTPILLPLVSHPEFSYDAFVERSPESPLNQLVISLQAWLKWLEERDALVEGRADAMAIAMVTSMSGLALWERAGVHGGSIEEDLVREAVRLVWRGGAKSHGDRT